MEEQRPVEQVKSVDWKKVSSYAVLGLMVLAFFMGAMMIWSGEVEAQTGTASIILTTDKERVEENSTFVVHAKATRGESTATTFQDVPKLSVWTHIDDGFFGFKLACWDHVRSAWLVVADDENIPLSCEKEGALSDNSGHASWDVTQIMPLKNSTTNADISSDQVARNLTIRVSGVVPSGVVVGNVVQQTQSGIEVVEEGHDMMGHAENPFKFGGYSGGQTSIILLSLIGLIYSAVKGWIATAIPSIMLLGKPLFENAGVTYPIDVAFAVLLFAIGVVMHMAIAKFGSQHQGEGGVV